MIYEIEIDKKLMTNYYTEGSEHSYKITEGGLPEGCNLVGVRGSESGQNLILSFFKNDGASGTKTLTPIITTRRE